MTKGVSEQTILIIPKDVYQQLIDAGYKYTGKRLRRSHYTQDEVALKVI
jgi:hypothetical protein